MTNMTKNGVTTTTANGQEQFEKFTRKERGGKSKTYFQYDYRHTDGELFTCIKPTLELCREARDQWVNKKEGAA